jgi:hypothetical protein
VFDNRWWQRWTGSDHEGQQAVTVQETGVTGERLTELGGKKKMMDNWCRLLGTSNLKEGAV